MKTPVETRKNRVWDVEEALWKQGASLHLPVDGAARCWVCRAPQGPVVAVFPDAKQAGTFLADWKALFPEEPVGYLQEIPLTPQGISNKALAVQRGETLSRWREEGGVLVATGGGLLGPVARGGGEILLEVEKEYERNALLDWLVHSGYVRSDLVWAPGQFVLRGYILDVYDPAYAYPLRLEFYDDTLESIRSFSPRTQKSVAMLDALHIHSLSITREASVLDFFTEARPGASTESAGEPFFLLFEPVKIESSAETYELLWKEVASVSGAQPLPSWQTLHLRLASWPTLRISSGVAYARDTLVLEEAPLFKGNLERFQWMCDAWRRDGYHIRLFTANPRLSSLYDDDLSVIEGALSKGFVDPLKRIVHISDLELSGISDRVASAGTVFAPPREWSEQLVEGRLLIHEEYGLCVFRGSEEVAISGEVMDSLVLEFADNKRLFLPVLQLHKITPLSEHADDDVQLDSLRGTRWKKSVAKTKERVLQEVRALLELYAKRELVEGFAFPPRDDLFDQFERSFPHAETKDQLVAISEILEDMERRFPMDRLLVGDVGYGKTEVALRAAFRAVQGGKQAALLVPTTILAQQHYLSFTARLTGFPVRVAFLSRFLSRKEQKDVLERVAAGEVDILIGTVRMLREDVAFKDLGLLIIDEEHRFGVMSKEKLKQARENVDVLMLSATPIPRTLALSLKGLRSISVLNEAPHNRIPVVTTAGPWSASIVKGAVSRELERGGQVYYVTNRITRMPKRLAFLRRLFPDVAIGMAHGRMKEAELEETMMGFYNGKIQILLCTTIIESGLDIPGANTIVIEDCQELGLAQMYQLRGRVGRREEAAYAYFLYPEGRPLAAETLERLDAITSLNDEGAGYDLALQDLRIRGSGDLLGTSQHGSGRGIADSHLYCTLLEEEIGKIRGVVPSAATVSAEIPCLVPSFYIPQENIRIALYRRLLRVGSLDELHDLEKEVKDRFGTLPESLENLFSISFLRSRGGFYGILSMECTRRETTLTGEGPLFDLLRTWKRWSGKEKKLSGPGGASGLRDVLLGLRQIKQVL